jgi:hypothetical protein
MPRTHLNRYSVPLMILGAIMMTGCDSGDERLARYAQQATEQQARQNERMAQQSEAVARQSQELASAAHQLVEQDAAARRELLDAHDKLQAHQQSELSTLNRQRDELDAERKAFAQASIRDPVIAQAMITSALALAALLPLLVTMYALKRLPEQSLSDELLADTLLDPLTSPCAMTLPADAESEGLPAMHCSRLEGQPDRSASDDES